MRDWNNGLGVVGTIYEEEEGEEEEEAEDITNSKIHSLTASPTSASSFPTPPLSSSSSSPPTMLQSKVEEWSRMTGSMPDVQIRVHDQCFNLHREPLVSRSRCLRQHLHGASSIEVPIPLPSSVAGETFLLVAAFCYGTVDLPFTPSNVVALHLAAEFLQMGSDAADDDNLLQRTDWYFRQAIASSAECGALLLRSCLRLISSGAGAALLAGRSLEALAERGEDAKGWVAELALASVDEFQMVAASLRARHVENHDLLYVILDRYLECRAGELTEEEKNGICSMVDCRKLTRGRVVELVQNPRMPLRFVMQAMLFEQFQTRAAVIDGISKASPTGNATLGDILQRETALRQVENLRAAMTATSFRIKSLEDELAMLRRMLEEEEEEEGEEEVGSERRRMGRRSVRSSSFRLHREVRSMGEEEEEEEGDDGSVERSSGVGEWKRRRGFGRMVSGIVRVLRGTWRVEVGSFSCRRDGDVVRMEELRGNRAVL